MAKLLCDIKFTGSIDGLCFYAMYGNYYIRTKSSLTGKRFWKDRVFEGSRRSCGLLTKASPIASLFYKTYPKEKKRRGLFNEMTGRVKLWLKEGKTEDEALMMLQENYPVIQKQPKKKKTNKGTIVLGKMGSVFTVTWLQKNPLQRKNYPTKKTTPFKRIDRIKRNSANGSG